MKTVLITGGTTGIGFACAQYLIKQGYQLIITGNTPANLNRAVLSLGQNAIGYVSDSAKMSDIDTLVEQIAQQYNKIDAVFINAGIFRAASFVDTDEALFDATMSINFKGAFFTVQKLLPILNNPTSVVLNTSIVVHKAFAGTSAYTASKAALESIAKVLNIELIEQGVRVNVISPGITDTDILRKSGMSDGQFEQLKTDLAKTSPIGRILKPEDIAPVLAFLLSDEAGVLRNEKIIVDGGTTL